MNVKISVIKDFLNGYVENRLEECRGIMAEDMVIDYSTTGHHAGRENIIEALRTEGDFAHRYNVISNIISYETDGETVIILNGFHFFVRVIRNEYLPLIFGGKYKFRLKAGEIRSIQFVLEAEMGNTYLAKTKWGYRMFAETKEGSKVLLDNVNMSFDEEKDAIQNTIYCMMLFADNGQEEMLGNVAKEDAHCFLSLNTYPNQYGPDSVDSGFTMREFVQKNKELKEQSHHSMKITDIQQENDKAAVTAQMFEPTKLGFKHFDALSVYKPYYNEIWTIQLLKEEGQWKISEMRNKAISKFQTVGYKTLEL